MSGSISILAQSLTDGRRSQKSGVASAADEKTGVDGQKIIPASLRNHVPALKNRYFRQTVEVPGLFANVAGVFANVATVRGNVAALFRNVAGLIVNVFDLLGDVFASFGTVTLQPLVAKPLFSNT